MLRATSPVSFGPQDRSLGGAVGEHAAYPTHGRRVRVELVRSFVVWVEGGVSSRFYYLFIVYNVVIRIQQQDRSRACVHVWHDAVYRCVCCRVSVILLCGRRGRGRVTKPDCYGHTRVPNLVVMVIYMYSGLDTPGYPELIFCTKHTLDLFLERRGRSPFPLSKLELLVFGRITRPQDLRSSTVRARSAWNKGVASRPLPPPPPRSAALST